MPTHLEAQSPLAPQAAGIQYGHCDVPYASGEEYRRDEHCQLQCRIIASTVPEHCKAFYALPLDLKEDTNLSIAIALPADAHIFQKMPLPHAAQAGHASAALD